MPRADQTTIDRLTDDVDAGGELFGCAWCEDALQRARGDAARAGAGRAAGAAQTV